MFGLSRRKKREVDFVGLVANVIKGALIALGAISIFAFVVPQPWVGIGFVGGRYQKWFSKDETINVLIRVVWWTLAAAAFYWAFEVFLIWAGIYAVLMSKDIWSTWKSGITDKGFPIGIFVGLWRVVPLVFEPLLFGHFKHEVEGWMKRVGPSDSSLKRFIQKEPREDPPELDDPEDSPQKGAEKRPRFVKGVEVPLDSKLEEYRGKKAMTLPSAEFDDYGMEPGVRYLVDFSIDEHHADKAGKHWDITWRHPTWGIVDRIVSPKSRLPEVGKPIQVIKSDLGHGHVSMENPPIIPKGLYGAGTSKVVYRGKAIVWTDPETHHLHMSLDNNQNYAFPKSQKGFMMVKMSDSVKGGKPVQHRERAMVFKDLSHKPETIAHYVKNGYAAEVKYDGAYFWLIKDKKGDIQLISRKAMIRDGKPVKHPKGGHQGINRASQIPGLYEAMEKVPNDTIVAVEVFSPGKGSYDSPHSRTAAVLNSNVVDSWTKQYQDGHLVLKELEVERYAGKDVSKNAFDADRALRQQIKEQTGGFLHMPKAVMTPEAAVALYEREKAHKNEGLVLKHRTDPSKPHLKVKINQDWDFKMVGIGPISPDEDAIDARTSHGLSKGPKKPSKWLVDGIPQGAGYIEYQTEGGAVGKAGSGLSDEMKRDLWNSPEKYLGEGNVVYRDGRILAKDPDKVPTTVVVRGMHQGRSGIVRAPVVVRFRDDK